MNPPTASLAPFAAVSTSSRARRLAFTSLLLLVVFAFWLTTLNQRSIWADEQSTNNIFALQNIPSVVGYVAQAERRPPAYFVLLWLWSRAVGTDEFANRYFSLLLSILVPPLTYALMRTLRRLHTAIPDSAPLFAFLLASLSPDLALYGVMLRYYSLVLCLANITILLTARWLLAQEVPGKQGWGQQPHLALRIIAAWLVVASILVYSDYSVLALVGAELLFLLAKFRELRWSLFPWAVATIVLTVLFLPQLASLREQASGGALDADLARVPLGVLLKFAYPALSFAFGETIFPWHPAVLLAIPFLFSIWIAWLRSQEIRPLVTFGIVLVLLPLTFNAFILTAIASDLTFLTAASRTLFVLPMYLITLASGVSVLPHTWGRLALVCIGLANLFALYNLITGQEYHNPIFVVPLRQVVQDVRAEVHAGDALLADLDIGVHLYWQPQPVAGTQFILSDDWPAPSAALAQNRPARVWLFVFGRDRTIASDHTEAIRAWLAPSYHLSSSREYAVVDSVYKAVKDRLLQRDTYTAKLTLLLFEHR